MPDGRIVRPFARQHGQVPDPERGDRVEGEARAQVIGLVEAAVLDAGTDFQRVENRSTRQRNSYQRRTVRAVSRSASPPVVSGIRIPRPERFAMHKPIVAERRCDGPDSSRAARDRAQADFPVAALAESRPDDLGLACEEVMSRGPGWHRLIAASLDGLPAVRRIIHEIAT